MNATQQQFKIGQFYSYIPINTWCHEGLAEVTKRGVLDTYWGTTSDSPLLEREKDSAVLLFDIADYDELDRYCSSSKHRWNQFHPNDRQKITEQHGLRVRWFIKKGASPDFGTKIENARERLTEAEHELRSAQWRVESRKAEVAELETEFLKGAK